MSKTETKTATRNDTAAPTVVPEGKYTRITYKGLSILTEMPLVDARNFASSFADQADRKTRQELRVWLGSIGGVVPDSRDALIPDGNFGDGALLHQNQALKSAIEHTDPAWRHLGIDETAGNPEMRTFEKTEHGFIRTDDLHKEPGLPDETGTATEQKKAEKDFAVEVGAPGVAAVDDGVKVKPAGIDSSDPKAQAEAVMRSKPIN